MNETSGILFSLGGDNPPVPGCTISKEILKSETGTVTLFSLAAGTDISPEIYDSERFILCLDGEISLEWPEKQASAVLHPDQALLTDDPSPFGIRALKDSVYLEISARPGTFNAALPREKVFGFSELVPVSSGRIVNMDVASGPGMKFVLMAFDAGTGLSEHAAPDDALLFGLEGKGIIGYEGKDYVLEKGQNFMFAGGGRHKVTAQEPFKMALLMELGQPAK